jgi:hypothetical protein
LQISSFKDKLYDCLKSILWLAIYPRHVQAPEVDDNIYDFTDVFAFGVVVWELFAKPRGRLVKPAKDQRPNLSMVPSEVCGVDMRNLIANCWKQSLR